MEASPEVMMSKNFDSNDETLKSAAEIAAERSDIAPEPQVGTESEKLRAAEAKAQENWDRLLRSQADLENYRKRMTRERQDLIKVANEKLLQDLLAPLDHLEMGLQSAQKNAQDDALRQGMEMVLAQFRQFLKQHGVTEIQATGETFNPALHEAVNYQESDLPEGQIVQQLRKGYRLHDKLLRPATVVVSKGKPQNEAEASS
jgi:molecular chaperone GrpE